METDENGEDEEGWIEGWICNNALSELKQQRHAEILISPVYLSFLLKFSQKIVELQTQAIPMKISSHITWLMQANRGQI